MDSEDYLQTSEDVVKKFLSSKLNVLKSRKLELERQLQLRSQILNKVHQEANIQANVSDTLKIISVWKKIVAAKYVIGINVNNNCGVRELTNPKLILSWDQKSPLTYTYKIFHRNNTPKPPIPATFTRISEKLSTTWSEITNDAAPSKSSENSWQPTQSITEIATLVTVINLPDFSDATVYRLNGLISYHEKTRRHVIIPEICMESGDVFNNGMKREQLESGETCSYLSLLAANEETNLSVFLGSNMRPFDRILEFDCAFRLVKVEDDGGEFYSAGCVCAAFEGAVLVLESNGTLSKMRRLKVFSRDENQLMFLINYLYKMIPDVVIIPSNSEATFLLANKESDREALKRVVTDLGSSMENEVKLVKRMCHEVFEDSTNGLMKVKENQYEKFKSFRLKLAELENETDLALYKFMHCSRFENEACAMDTSY